MEQRYLIDSNVIIDFFNGKLPENGKMFLQKILPEISIITNIELFATKHISESEKNQLEKFVKITKVHDVNSFIINDTIEIRQNYKIKLPDAIIAATAIVNNCMLITRNEEDFKNISYLQVLNPWII